MISSEREFCTVDESFRSPWAQRFMVGNESTDSSALTHTPLLTLLGTGQDGGVPQAGCSCANCLEAFVDGRRRRYPVAVGVRDATGGLHLIEATRALPEQLRVWATALGANGVVKPDSVMLTHAHLGHIEGLGQFGREAMGVSDLPLVASESVCSLLASRGLLAPFDVRALAQEESARRLGLPGVDVHFIPVPHRDDASDTHAIMLAGKKNRVLFLPDHDDWGQTLAAVGHTNPMDWFAELRLTHVLLDATFWSADELPGRDITQVPHPLVEETLGLIGGVSDDGAEVHLIHLNHSNPLNEPSSTQRRAVEIAGLRVGQRGWTIEL